MAARTLALFALVAALAACAHDYEARFTSGPRGAPLLPLEASILVGIPLDAREAQFVYLDSGRITSDEILNALAPHTGAARAAESAETLETYAGQARESGLDYVIFPEILIWQDHNTRTLGIPDLLELRLTLVDAGTGDVLDVATLSASSRITPSWSDEPRDLLPGSLARYAARVFEGE